MKLKIVRVVIAIALVIVCYNYYTQVINTNTKHYLTTIPDEGIILFRIKYSISIADNGIGNEWSSSHYLNGEPINTQKTYSIPVTQSIKIKTVFIESDPSIDDTGSNETSSYFFTSNNSCKDVFTITNKVSVTGRGGRDSGKTARCSATYTLRRVLPKGISWLSMAFNPNYDASGNMTKLYIATSVALLDIGYCIFAYICDSKKAKENERIEREKRIKLEKEEQERKEQIRLEKIQTQIKRAQKNGYAFSENGIPTLGNTTSISPYGSLTAYVSKNGTRFHIVRECSNAIYPRHLYGQTDRYIPCRICAQKYTKEYIPEWFFILCINKYEPFVRKAFTCSANKVIPSYDNQEIAIKQDKYGISCEYIENKQFMFPGGITWNSSRTEVNTILHGLGIDPCSSVPITARIWGEDFHFQYYSLETFWNLSSYSLKIYFSDIGKAESITVHWNYTDEAFNKVSSIVNELYGKKDAKTCTILSNFGLYWVLKDGYVLLWNSNNSYFLLHYSKSDRFLKDSFRPFG